MGMPEYQYGFLGECANISEESGLNCYERVLQQGTVMVKSVFIELRNAASRLNKWGRGNLLHVGTNTPLFFSSLSLGGVCECECVSVLQDLSSPTRDGTCAPAVEAPSPNPWVASSEKAPRTPALPKAALILPLSVSSCCIIFLQ